MTCPDSPTPALAELIDLPESHSPSLSADGNTIAYISNQSGLPQLWLCDADGTHPRQLTKLDERVVEVAFAPRGNCLVFTTDVGMDERYQLWLADLDSGDIRALTASPSVVHQWGAWAPDGDRIAFAANRRDPFCMDIYLLDIASKTSRLLRRGSGFQQPISFTREGDGIFIKESRYSAMNQALVLLNIGSGEARTLAPGKGNKARFGALKTAADGRGVYLLSDDQRRFKSLYLLDPSRNPDDDSMQLEVADDDHDIEYFALLSSDPSGGDERKESFAWVANQNGFSRLWIADGQMTGEPQKQEVELPYQGVISSLSSQEGRLIISLASPTRPASIWQYDLVRKLFSQLTQNGHPQGAHQLSDKLVEPHTAEFVSSDGFTIPYFVYTPLTTPPASGWPLLFIVHGGPESQWIPAFRADIQHYLARGIMVIAPNVRGSTGYGREFFEADDLDKRTEAVRDLIELASDFSSRSEIDSARIGVMGQSYGGFMVLAAITAAPHLWRTAVDIYGISNFTTLMQTTGPWRRDLRAAEYGDPIKQKTLLEALSPIHQLDKIKAPLLIVHCSDDPRVPIEQSEQLYSRLKGLGKESAILRVAHEGHGFSRTNNKYRAFATIADWLNDTL